MNNSIVANLYENLIEIRSRLIIISVAFVLALIPAYYLKDIVINFLLHPLLAIISNNSSKVEVIYTSLPSAFLVNIKIMIYIAVIISFPVILFQLWQFVSQGLFKNERRFMLVCLSVSPLLFFLGASLAYFIALPVTWNFFGGFQFSGSNIDVKLLPELTNYISLTLWLIVCFGFSFELPIFLIILTMAGVIDKTWLKKNRRYAFLLSFVIAAILTPPDVISQIILAFPLYLLYEISILFAFSETNVEVENEFQV